MKYLYHFLFSLMLLITIGYFLFVPNPVNGLVFENHSSNSVYFSNVHHIEKIGYSEDIGEGLNPVKIQSTDNMSLDFNISFSLPGDQYSFYVDVKNDSDVPVEIQVLSNELDDYSKQFFHYSILGIDHNKLSAHESMTIQVVIEYKSDVTELPLEDIMTYYQTRLVATQV